MKSASLNVNERVWYCCLLNRGILANIFRGGAMRKISAHWGWIIVCSAVMLNTGCASENAKSLLERNQERLQLNEALFDAVENGQTDMVRDLVRHGADVDVRGILGKNTAYPSKEWTPLLVASYKGYTKIAAILLENRADIHAQNSSTRTPLHLASEKGHIEIAKLLIAKGADVHAASSHDQWTPLHMAAYYGQTTVALVLLTAGADPFVKNIQGSTPLDYAREKGLNTVVKTIEAQFQKP
jgi:ankyrin repeat protein